MSTANGGEDERRTIPAIDERLWVRLTNGETAYLVGNPHTNRGHFDIWRPDVGGVYTCALYEVAERSDEAGYWLDGYLAASEPDPEAIWGDRVIDLEDFGPEMIAWRAAAHHFRLTGKWVPKVVCAHCGALQLPREVIGACDRCGLPAEPEEEEPNGGDGTGS
jgi:hypothetical protein